MLDLPQHSAFGRFEFVHPVTLADIELRCKEVDQLAVVVVDRAQMKLVPEGLPSFR